MRHGKPGPAKMHGNKGYKDGHPKPTNRSDVKRKEGVKRAMKQNDQHDIATKRKGSKGTGLRKKLEGMAL
ncbi:MAG TPA: hypothetical protein VF748_14680 [Candidatus Acidoferrum sp.]